MSVAAVHPGEGYDAFVQFLNNGSPEPATTPIQTETASSAKPAQLDTSIKSLDSSNHRRKGNEYTALIKEKSMKKQLETKANGGTTKRKGNEYTELIKQKSMKKQLEEKQTGSSTPTARPSLTPAEPTPAVTKPKPATNQLDSSARSLDSSGRRKKGNEYNRLIKEKSMRKKQEQLKQ